MKLTPVASPHAIQTPQTSSNTSSRTAAIAAFERASASPQQSQEHPVQNPNQVSPEELSAIKAPTGVADTQPETQVLETLDNSPNSEAADTKLPPKDSVESKRWAQLARQERQLRAKAQAQDAAIKAREAALVAREAELQAKAQEYSPEKYISRSRIKQDPLGVLQDEQVSYDELTQQILSQQPTDPRIMRTIQNLQEEIKSLKTANEETRKSYDTQQAESRSAAIKQIEVDVRGLIKNDPNYETIRATGSVRDVVDLITQTYDKDGVLLTVEEAAQEVENYLVDEAMKLTTIGKIKQKLSQAAQLGKTGAKTPANQQTQQTKTPMKTLTNAHGSTRKLTARERAIAIAEGRPKTW